MAKVKYISSPNEVPAGRKYVLVMYGEEYAQTTHPLGLTITVARTVSQLSFLTAEIGQLRQTRKKPIRLLWHKRQMDRLRVSDTVPPTR